MFVHQIDPLLCQFAGFHIWYYGVCYALGFLGVHAWLSQRRKAIGWSRADALGCAIYFAAGILIMGRLFEIIVYEGAIFRAHPERLFSIWRGGMASHGVLLGGVLGLWTFCHFWKKSFLVAADEVTIPAALLLALGRLGNFINGEIYGPVTDVWWAVQFPYAEGFRHPVTLYEGAKNLVVLGILLYVRRRTMPGRGLLLAHFVFWYGFLRIFADLYREYGVEFLGIGRGQYYNLFMALLGLILWFVFARRAPAASATTSLEPQPDPPATLLWPQRLVFAALVTLALTIPSGWSKDWLAEHRPPPLAAVDAADALR